MENMKLCYNQSKNCKNKFCNGIQINLDAFFGGKFSWKQTRPRLRSRKGSQRAEV